MSGGEVQERTEVWACGIFADVVMGFSALDRREEDKGRLKGDGKTGLMGQLAAESRPSVSHGPPRYGPHHSLYHAVWLAAFQHPGK